MNNTVKNKMLKFNNKHISYDDESIQNLVKNIRVNYI